MGANGVFARSSGNLVAAHVLFYLQMLGACQWVVCAENLDLAILLMKTAENRS